jgi:hypothetical protein
MFFQTKWLSIIRKHNLIKTIPEKKTAVIGRDARVLLIDVFPVNKYYHISTHSNYVPDSVIAIH